MVMPGARRPAARCEQAAHPGKVPSKGRTRPAPGKKRVSGPIGRSRARILPLCLAAAGPPAGQNRAKSPAARDPASNRGRNAAN